MARKKKEVKKGNRWQEAAKTILECIQATNEKFGKKKLIQILLGEKNDLEDSPLTNWHGMLKEQFEFKELIRLFDFLERKKMIFQNLKRGNVYLSKQGKKFLEKTSSFKLEWDELEIYHLPYEYGLFQYLRIVRRNLSEKMGVKPYRICSDALLERIAMLRPKTIGYIFKEEKHLLKYMPESVWLEFLHAIRLYEIEKKWIRLEENLDKTKHYAVKELVEQNKSLQEIRDQLQLKKVTIMKYIEELSALGKLNPTEWLKEKGWLNEKVEEAARFIQYTGIRSWSHLKKLFTLTYEQFWASRILSYVIIGNGEIRI